MRGLSIFAEYLDDPEATASAFTEDGFFRTGDVVRLREDGALVFVERLKDMLKVGGENVAASEVETVARRVAGVKEIAVVARPDPFLIDVPYAFVIPQPDAPADLADQVIAACRKALADFKVPRGVRVVEDFPRSMGGAKVVKAALRQMLRDEAGAA
jgi:crotonobetaine/carnitine-CoA ligase